MASNCGHPKLQIKAFMAFSPREIIRENLKICICRTIIMFGSFKQIRYFMQKTQQSQFFCNLRILTFNYSTFNLTVGQTETNVELRAA